MGMEKVLKSHGVDEKSLPFWIQWLELYLGFCKSRQLPSQSVESARVFLEWFSQSGRAPFQREQASRCIRIYQKSFDSNGVPQPASSERPDGPRSWKEARKMMEDAIRARQYSRKTLRAYIHWLEDFSLYADPIPLDQITSQEAKNFLSHLATDRNVAPSTQNQAFNGLLFLFTHILKRDFAGLADTPRAKRVTLVPTVLSREEITRLLRRLDKPYQLVAQMLYGCGLRLGEGIGLRIQDLDFELRRVIIHSGKGKKSRSVPMPERLVPLLHSHIEKVRIRFEQDLEQGFDGVFLPGRLEEKLPRAAWEWGWYWLFPAPRLVAADSKRRRYHLHETGFQKAIKAAVSLAGITKRASAHTLRHSYATHLLQMGYDIRTIQDLLGHADLDTTMIYTHAAQSLAHRVVSPFDELDGDTGVRENHVTPTLPRLPAMTPAHVQFSSYPIHEPVLMQHFSLPR